MVESIKHLLQATDNLLSDDTEKTKEDEKMAQNLIRCTKDLKLILRDLSTSVYRKENATFIHAAKGLITSMNDILDMDTALGLDKYWSIKNATANVINISKQTLGGRANFNTFQNARVELTDTLHLFIIDANKRSVEIRKALRKKEIPNFGPKELPKDPLLEKDFKLKRSAAMKLTNILTHKFDGFYKQWTQQTPEEADELYDTMVEEMGKHFLHYVAEKEREEQEKKEKERREADNMRRQAEQAEQEYQRQQNRLSPQGIIILRLYIINTMKRYAHRNNE